MKGWPFSAQPPKANRPLESALEYRGYHFEEKQLMVGWQITIRQNDVFVLNGMVSAERSAALADARAHVDARIARA